MGSDVTKKIEEFFKPFKQIEYKKREVVVRPGDLPQGVYFLKKGYARLYSIFEDGEELSLVIYSPGEFFPVVWTFFGERASIYTFETYTPATLVRAPREKFVEFLRENPDVLMDVTKHIITRFQIALKRMEYLTFGNASSQLASILLIFAKEIGIKKEDGIQIEIPFTHKDLANLVGVTRETISVELKKLEKQEIVKRKGKYIFVTNLKTLRKMAGVL